MTPDMVTERIKTKLKVQCLEPGKGWKRMQKTNSLCLLYVEVLDFGSLQAMNI